MTRGESRYIWGVTRIARFLGFSRRQFRRFEDLRDASGRRHPLIEMTGTDKHTGDLILDREQAVRYFVKLRYPRAHHVASAEFEVIWGASRIAARFGLSRDKIISYFGSRNDADAHPLGKMMWADPFWPRKSSRFGKICINAIEATAYLMGCAAAPTPRRRRRATA